MTVLDSDDRQRPPHRQASMSRAATTAAALTAKRSLQEVTQSTRQLQLVLLGSSSGAAGMPTAPLELQNVTEGTPSDTQDLDEASWNPTDALSDGEDSNGPAADTGEQSIVNATQPTGGKETAAPEGSNTVVHDQQQADNNDLNDADIQQVKDMFHDVIPDNLNDKAIATAENHTTTFDDDIYTNLKPNTSKEHITSPNKQDPGHHVIPPPKHSSTLPPKHSGSSTKPNLKPPGNNLQVKCNPNSSRVDFYMCKAAISIDSNPIPFMLLVGFISFLCIWRCCRRRRDRRGEYRAVAEQYAGLAFDDTFDDNYSQNGDDMIDGGFDDYEDDGWSSSGKHSIELATIGDEENGGLTLEEMNG